MEIFCECPVALTCRQRTSRKNAISFISISSLRRLCSMQSPNVSSLFCIPLICWLIKILWRTSSKTVSLTNDPAGNGQTFPVFLCALMTVDFFVELSKKGFFHLAVVLVYKKLFNKYTIFYSIHITALLSFL